MSKKNSVPADLIALIEEHQKIEIENQLAKEDQAREKEQQKYDEQELIVAQLLALCPDEIMEYFEAWKKKSVYHWRLYFFIPGLAPFHVDCDIRQVDDQMSVEVVKYGCANPVESFEWDEIDHAIYWAHNWQATNFHEALVYAKEMQELYEQMKSNIISRTESARVRNAERSTEEKVEKANRDALLQWVNDDSVARVLMYAFRLVQDERENFLQTISDAEDYGYLIMDHPL